MPTTLVWFGLKTGGRCRHYFDYWEWLDSANTKEVAGRAASSIEDELEDSKLSRVEMSSHIAVRETPSPLLCRTGKAWTHIESNDNYPFPLVGITESMTKNYSTNRKRKNLWDNLERADSWRWSRPWPHVLCLGEDISHPTHPIPFTWHLRAFIYFLIPYTSTTLQNIFSKQKA